jgi:hypothetical protein
MLKLEAGPGIVVMPKLEGPGSRERLERLQSRFRTLSRRQERRAPARVGIVAISAALFVLTYALASASLDFGSPLIALRHFAAVGSCHMAASVGLAPAHSGQPGYWAIHDRDQNGVACD